MKDKIEWVKYLASTYDFGDWFGIGAGVTMGIINTFAMIHGKSRVFAALLSFYFGLSFMRLVLLILKKTKHTRACAMDLASALFLSLAMPTFNIALFVLENGEVLIDFPFEFMIYGYAFYAFYKMVSAIRSIFLGKKEKSPYLQCIAVFSTLSAAYTMISLMVNLVYQTGGSENHAMQQIELSLLIITMLYELVMIIVLAVRGFRDLKQYRLVKQENNNPIASR